MKKRLLITSIVMMLVVAVALSTATYAWFTSNATVTSDAVTLTAASNNAASLGIGWTKTGTFGPSITPTSPAVDNPETEDADEGVYFAPALPNQLTVGTTYIDKDSELNTNEIDFKTALATPNNDGDMKFMTPSGTTPYNWNNGTEQSFFIKNMSPANEIPSVTVRATISGTGVAPSLIRVAVFKWDSNQSKYILLGVLANTTSYTHTVVAENTKLTAADGTYFKKYLGQYVPAVSGTADEVAAGAADYFRDAENSGANATQAPAGKFYTREDKTQAEPAGVNHAEVAYGTITAGNSVNAMTTAYCVESIVVTEHLAHGATEEFKVLVWEDAVALGDTEQGLTSTVALTFTAG